VLIDSKMSTRKVDAILNNLEKHSSLTRDGRNWLIAAIDPFHDSDLALAGYPDVLTSNTVVQLIKQQVQISVPGLTGGGAVANGANWDCSICLFPSAVTSPLNNATTVASNGTVTSSNTTTGTDVGGLVAVAGPQGAQLWPDAGNAYTPNGAYTFLDAHNYVKGQGRIISMGFEVVNTTAELYKQGQVTAWRMPGKFTPTSIYSQTAVGPPAIFSQTTGLCQRLPPSTVAKAQLLYGSRSWAAEEGAYVVCRQNTDSNPASIPSFQYLMYTADDVSSENTATFVTGPGPAVLAAPTQFSDYYAPFDLSGVTFTGLSYTTSLTVNVRWFIERIPGPSEPDLVVMATPSAPYDPLALELYTQCLRDMPPGVMLKENPLGEWFREALQGVAEWAPKIGSALGGIIPGAGAIGSGLGGVAGVTAGFIPKAVKKQVKKQVQRAEQAIGKRFIGPANQAQSQNDRRFMAVQAARGNNRKKANKARAKMPGSAQSWGDGMNPHMMG
jgi:hypothetical protein